MTLAIIGLLAASLQADSQTPLEQELKANNQLIVSWLDKNVPADRRSELPVPIDDALLVDLAKGTTFHSLHFREFPLQMVPPKPFTSRNVFAVSKGLSASGRANPTAPKKMTLWSTRPLLEVAFPKLVREVAKSGMKDMGFEWLKVATVFDQDGFFQFVFDDRNVTTNGMTVTARAPVVEKGGDTGVLTATLTFQPGGTSGRYKLVKITESDTIKPGVRPVCQCTLLLDENPVVRRMAERDLLVMGKYAFPYMRDQMAKATPELRKEIERVWKRIENGDR